ncbi:MAG TPA: ABC transporter permease [Bacillales bacterium]|nr:ABC transporter permease [Bacillales bacterium]
MRKFWVVLFHTYVSKLRTKQFIFPTLIVAVLLLGITNLPSIVNLFDNNEADKVMVLDRSGKLYEPLSEKLNQEDIELVKGGKSEADAKEAVKDGEVSGYLLLTLNEKGLPSGVYKAERIANQEISGELKTALQQVKITMATSQLGLNQQEIASIYTPVAFDEEALKKGAKTEEELNFARGAVYVLMFMLYLFVLFYGMMIAMEVATEKSSRAMEILISSVSPVKQMLGKIFGVVSLGLTQIAFLCLVGASSLKFLGGFDKITQMFGMTDISNMPLSMVIYAVVFFILGYFLYATLFAMLGSLVDRVEEANQMLMPVTMMLVIAFFIAVTGLGNPSSSLITITSFIPFFAPMTMFLRVGMIAVPWWQVAISIALLVATILLFIGVGSRVYRGGVLMYGNTSWKNLKEAFALSKSEKA